MKVEFYIITEKGAAKTVLQNEKHGEEEIFLTRIAFFTRAFRGNVPI